ncbi:MAG TPA: polysaccharide biosynthesis C-terminal domain-containing protein [Stellaceae bacterium]
MGQKPVAPAAGVRFAGVRNFAVTWFSFIVRLVGQLGYFLLIARGLGPHNYGMVASVIALLTVSSAVCGWGSDHVLIRHVTVAPERFGAYFGNALLQNAVTALPLGLLAFGAQYLMVGMATWAFVAFALGELLFARLHVVAVAAFMAFERGNDLFVLNAGFGMLRVAACVAAIGLSHPLTVEIWAQWYLGAVMLTGVLALVYTVWRLGPPHWYFARQDVGLGFHFCLYFTADSALRDIDKPLVAYLAGPLAAGLYNAAFRIVDAMAVPLRALMAAFYARFFKHGQDGIEQSFQFALRVLPLTLGYTLFAGLALTFGADLLPLILGEKFRAAVPVTTTLAFLPVFGGLTSIGGDILTSAGRQRTRAIVVSCLCLSPVLFAYLLVPRFGAMGAAYAALGNGAMVAVTIWIMVILSRRKAARWSAAAQPRTV